MPKQELQNDGRFVYLNARSYGGPDPANTGAILALFQCHLTQQLKLECSAKLLTELQLVSLFLPKSMRGLWGVRCHHWLSQSMKLQQEDRACLLWLTVETSAMFENVLADMPQQAQEACCCTREMSGALGGVAAT